jgi:hypothetical protein
MNPRFVAVIRSIALIWLPAAATAALSVGAIWNYEYAQQIANTIIAVDTFLGVGLGVTNVAGHGFDGEFVVHDVPDGDGTKGIFNLLTPLDKLPSRNELRFKVKPGPKVTVFQQQLAPIGQPPEEDPPAST